MLKGCWLRHKKLIFTDKDVIAYRQIGEDTCIRPVLIIQGITHRFVRVGIDRCDRTIITTYTALINHCSFGCWNRIEHQIKFSNVLHQA